ncbi:MAG: Wzz/FepE/Etk N-terminal domain-containing protein [Intestinibacter bartlettii]
MKDTMTISLRELFTIIKKKLWIIALVGIIFGLITAGVNQFLLKPVYEANTTIITNKEVDERKFKCQLVMILHFHKGWLLLIQIITSDTVLNQVIDNLNLKMKAKIS